MTKNEKIDFYLIIMSYYIHTYISTSIMSDYNQLWKPWTEIPIHKLINTTKTFQGYSIAGLRTNFFVQPDLMLDAGIFDPF